MEIIWQYVNTDNHRFGGKRDVESIPSALNKIPFVRKHRDAKAQEQFDQMHTAMPDHTIIHECIGLRELRHNSVGATGLTTPSTAVLRTADQPIEFTKVKSGTSLKQRLEQAREDALRFAAIAHARLLENQIIEDTRMLYP